MEQERKAAFLAGEWTVEPELNALRRDDVERHIEPKVMKVLLTLASQQNHVFSKDEIISAVWPDTFVSDDALTRCISILRRITEDDPHAPHFIQTVPKRGYRLVAPVGELPSLELAREGATFAPDPMVPEPAGTAFASVSPSPAGLGRAAATEIALPAHTGPHPRWWTVLGLLGAILLIVGAVWVRSATRTNHAAAEDTSAFRTMPFTSYAGEQVEPAFSPDGEAIAFIRIAEDASSRRIWIKRIGGESVHELTRDDDEQFSPAWSPDGHRIAYLAHSRAGLGLFVADAAGTAPARRVFIPQEPSHWEQGALSWSPDGKSLIFPDHAGTAPNSSIFRLDLDSLRVQSLTSPPAGWEGDLNPAYSPDGARIAFTRASETAVRDIYWISVADGSLHPLTHDRMNIDSLAWSRDGASIVFSSNRGGKYSLWRVALNGGGPERLPVGTEDAYQPAVGSKPGELAYTQGSAIWSIDRLTSAAGSAPGSQVQAVLSSTQQDSAPSLAPDARSFAFQSRRSGNQEIWIASLDGNTLRQLTSMNGPVTGSPAWSHAGDRILFDSRPDGHSHIFCMSATGGHATQLTFGNANDIVPRWSRDDQAVYFRSNRGGRWQIWKVSVHGGDPQPITTNDGIAAEESPDGRWLYYTRGDDTGLWRVPAGGGPESLVLAQPAAGYWGYFQVTRTGIYLLDRGRTTSAILRYVPETGQTTRLFELPQPPPPYQGLAASEDGKVLLLTGERDAGRHITLVEGNP